MATTRPFDPVVSFKNSQGEAARGTLTNIQRRSLVMEVYNPYSIVQVSEVLSELTVRAGPEQTVYKGKAFVNGMVNTGLMAVVSVTLIDEWSEFHAIGQDLSRVKEEAELFAQEWDGRFKIRRNYQVIINEMRTFYSEVNRWMDQIDINSSLPKDADGRLREDIFFEISAPLYPRAKAYLEDFEAEANDVGPEESSAHRSHAQTAIHPLILRAPFVYRTFAKPLGYAGDYEMVNQILGDPRQGPSSYFQLVNFMYLQAQVAEAHRNRIDILVERITKNISQKSEKDKTLFKLMTVGCGPAFELEKLIATNIDLDNIEITLLDFSKETLEFTKSKLLKIAKKFNKNVVVKIQHDSVHLLLLKTLRRSDIQDLEKYDLIYCAGLFDYLSDKVCNRLIQYFTAYLKINSKIILTNVHKSNPEKNWMEHFLEWHLIYRNEKDFYKLLPQSLTDIECFTDKTGVNVFIEANVNKSDAT